MIELNYVIDLSACCNGQLSFGVVVSPDDKDTSFRNLIEPLRVKFYSAATSSNFICPGTLFEFHPIAQLIEFGIRCLFLWNSFRVEIVKSSGTSPREMEMFINGAEN